MKKYKISKEAIEDYKRLCKNYHDCNDIDRIKYQIQKSVSLGQTIRLFGKRLRRVGYYDLQFLIDKNEIYDITRSNDSFVQVSDNVKYTYEKHFKVKRGLFNRLFGGNNYAYKR